jgi:hypothetical protein
MKKAPSLAGQGFRALRQVWGLLLVNSYRPDAAGIPCHRVQLQPEVPPQFKHL